MMLFMVFSLAIILTQASDIFVFKFKLLNLLLTNSLNHFKLGKIFMKYCLSLFIIIYFHTSLGLDINLPFSSAQFAQYKQAGRQLVVAGIIKKDGKILLAQRNLKTTFPGKWSFIGGKVEIGESLHAALRREILEEVELDAQIGEQVDIVSYDYKGLKLEIYFFYVHDFTGEIRLNSEHINYAWVYPNEIDKYDLIPANFSIIKKLQDQL